MSVLMIDNYDSFTYNIVQYFGELGQDIEVFRNDQITLDDIAARQPRYLVIGPGPCSPTEAGVSLQVIRQFAGRIPLLGVCLGHQAIGQAFGGRVVRARQVMHGRLSAMYHSQVGIFAGLPSPFEATRYHSLLVERATFPKDLEITAETAEGETSGPATGDAAQSHMEEVD